MKENKSLYWAKKCADTNNSSYLVPKDLVEKAKNFLTNVESVNELQRQLIKKQGALDIVRLTFWQEMREYIEKTGGKDAFIKGGIDFDKSALEDGVFVVNLFDQQAGAPLNSHRR